MHEALCPTSSTKKGIKKNPHGGIKLENLHRRIVSRKT
jgi:hypothetical protein